ncbi:MAG TPA: hypothetical protein VF547_07555 [Allosphingosinicella sp.]|jgi:hypothetical protein
MNRRRHALRGRNGRYVAAAAKAEEPGLELKRGRGDRVGGRPQIRRKRKDALTESEKETFLSTFAETCNIAHSARTVGRKERVFRDLKKRDPGFAADWMATLRESYDLLEAEMARRARFGTRKDVFHQGRRVARIRVFNDAMALRLLSLHRSSVERMRAAESAPRRDAKTLFDELAARVAEIKAKRAKDAEGGDHEAA